MTKLKLYGLIAVVGVLVLGGTAFAFAPQFNWGRVEDKVADRLTNKVSEPHEEVLGALTSPDIQNLYLGVNGDVTYHIVQRFIDASTTIVSFSNPFGTATATVELTNLNITSAATSSFTVSCGASASAIAAPDNAIISSGSVATSSVGIVENNLTAALGGVANGGTVPKVALTVADPFFVCNVTATNSNAFTNANNTFDGKATVRISHTQ